MSHLQLSCAYHAWTNFLFPQYWFIGCNTSFHQTSSWDIQHLSFNCTFQVFYWCSCAPWFIYCYLLMCLRLCLLVHLGNLCKFDILSCLVVLCLYFFHLWHHPWQWCLPSHLLPDHIWHRHLVYYAHLMSSHLVTLGCILLLHHILLNHHFTHCCEMMLPSFLVHCLLASWLKLLDSTQKYSIPWSSMGFSPSYHVYPPSKLPVNLFLALSICMCGDVFQWLETWNNVHPVPFLVSLQLILRFFDCLCFWHLCKLVHMNQMWF